MKFTALSTGSLMLVRFNGKRVLGERVGDLYWGIDAFHCSPSDFMGVGAVIINVSWSSLREWKVRYVAPPISDIPKEKVVMAFDTISAVKALEKEIGREVDGLLRVEPVE